MSTFYTPTTSAVSPLQTVSSFAVVGSATLPFINQYVFATAATTGTTLALQTAPSGSWVCFNVSGANAIVVKGTSVSNTSISFIVNTSGVWTKMKCRGNTMSFYTPKSSAASPLCPISSFNLNSNLTLPALNQVVFVSTFSPATPWEMTLPTSAAESWVGLRCGSNVFTCLGATIGSTPVSFVVSPSGVWTKT